MSTGTLWPRKGFRLRVSFKMYKVSVNTKSCTGDKSQAQGASSRHLQLHVTNHRNRNPILVLLKPYGTAFSGPERGRAERFPAAQGLGGYCTNYLPLLGMCCARTVNLYLSVLCSRGVNGATNSVFRDGRGVAINNKSYMQLTQHTSSKGPQL